MSAWAGRERWEEGAPAQGSSESRSRDFDSWYGRDPLRLTFDLGLWVDPCRFLEPGRAFERGSPLAGPLRAAAGMARAFAVGWWAGSRARGWDDQRSVARGPAASPRHSHDTAPTSVL